MHLLVSADGLTRIGPVGPIHLDMIHQILGGPPQPVRSPTVPEWAALYVAEDSGSDLQTTLCDGGVVSGDILITGYDPGTGTNRALTRAQIRQVALGGVSGFGPRGPMIRTLAFQRQRSGGAPCP